MQYATQRGFGAKTGRVQFSFDGLPYSLTSHRLMGEVPVELLQEAAILTPGIDMCEEAVVGVQDIIALNFERNAAAIARSLATYGAGNKIILSGSSQWSDYTSGVSDPSKDIDDAIEAIRSKIGKDPNVMILGPKVARKLRRHPKILDYFKAKPGNKITKEQLMEYFEIENILVGKSISADDNNVIGDVWGKDVCIAYSNLDLKPDRYAPSFAYGYRLMDYPFVEEMWQDRDTNSYLMPVSDEVAPVITGADGGYLISNAIA